MTLATNVDEFPKNLSTAVTVGKFDGVHLGHQAVLKRLKELADKRGLQSAVLTFDRNPLELFRPEHCPPVLISLQQKVELLRAEGPDLIAVLPFTAEFAATSPEDFVRGMLNDRLGARLILVGPDFRFGHRGRGDVALLGVEAARYGIDVVVLEDQTEAGLRVSSTRIRELLSLGEVARAAALLGREPSVRGVVVHGAKRGRELGFPTANLAAECEGLIPADGVYAGFFEDAGRRYPAAISVGSNPTFEGVPAQQVEAHLPGEDLDLYGHHVEISFRHRIRGMVAFSSVQELATQIRHDVAETRRLLAATP